MRIQTKKWSVYVKKKKKKNCRFVENYHKNKCWIWNKFALYDVYSIEEREKSLESLWLYRESVMWSVK